MKKSIATMLSVIAVFATTTLSAQDIKADTTDQFSISGSVDTYFHKSFGRQEQAPTTSFANLPGFSLGMVNLVAGYTSAKSGFVADLVVGPRGSDAVFHAPGYTNAQGGGSSHLINQMYAYYQLTNNIRVGLGQFNTFLGYETISPVRNFHYSTSYLFTYGPFNHTGVWADFNLSGGWTAKLAVMNPTDYTEFNPFDSYTLGAQLGFSGSSGLIYLSATYGDPDGKLHNTDSIGSQSAGQAIQLDLVASTSIGERYSIGFGTSFRSSGTGQIKTALNSEYGGVARNSFYGAVLYQQIAVHEFVKLGLRAEYFSEANGGVGAIGTYNNDGNAWICELTFSANIEVNQFKFIPEVRIDRASKQIYSGASSGNAENQLVSLNMAVVYKLPQISKNISKNIF
jgi:hypothetical protein